jgi:hypothetical protein
MAKRKSKDIYLMPEPNWTSIHNAKTDAERKKLYQGYAYFVHYEVADKKAMASVTKWLAQESGLDKELLKKLSKVPDVWFSSYAKYCYIWDRSKYMPEDVKQHLIEKIPLLEERAEIIIEEKQAAEKEKAKAPVISIQQRMRDQVSEMCAEWDGLLDELVEGDRAIKDFDPYKALVSNPVVKAAHAKIVKDMYDAEYQEALLVAEWKDEEIKEAYCHLSAKTRKAFLEFFEKINTACDTLINTQKATRKTRRPKAVSKEKVVAKLKYKINDGELGIASINPIEIIDANEVWVYNTKNRKLGIYVADLTSLSVKGTSITGFDTIKSVQKTLRKPLEQLKQFKGTAKTKWQKAFKEIKSTDTKLNGRLNEHTIIMKAF